MSKNNILNVLFICTGNSARSVLAESILNKEGRGRFKAFSAGSHPSGKVHPMALKVLASLNYPTDNLRSKDWSEFAEPGAPGAPKMDFTFTVCDNAAGEVCPVWPGQPMTAHWGFQDPAAFEGPEVEQRTLFLEIFKQIKFRIGIFINLPLASLDKISLQKQLDEIGRPLNG
ncbi:MAG: arsenate reductase ArsC [Rhodospirillales bacterium]|jgi:arsenate reductase